MSEPFAHVAGPRDAKMVVVGEAWGEMEERYGVPFAGQSGREFARMLVEAGFDDTRGTRGTRGTLARAVSEISDVVWLALREEWLQAASIMLTNVFALRPRNNNLGALCAAKSELAGDYDLPPVRTENPRYVRSEYLPHLQRLGAELCAHGRNLVLSLGGTATWATLGTSAIGRLRGAVCETRPDSPVALGGVKCLPTYHPAAILRAWQWRPIVLADLLKARREVAFPEVRRPNRRIVINPTLDDVLGWAAHTLWAWKQDKRYKLLAPDIETMNGQIRCIGFARSASEAMVVPFIMDLSGASYWSSEQQEYMAWEAVRALLESDVPKVFQNGLFDIQYLAKMGFRVRNVSHDTMLLHHVLYPEMQKSLGFLGSAYANEAAWKLMRLHKGEEELKRDE